jgi:predicted solute-binding protein
LRIGCVKYLNARPLIDGWPGPVVLDHPSALCQQLAGGELDAALVSSFEFLRNPIYQIVDGVSIASDGPVYSVLVAHPDRTVSSEIELDPASLTSVALLQYLVAERSSRFCPVDLTSDVLSSLVSGRARLLIGDQAIRFRQKFGQTYRYWDLGEEWKGLTGLPFVYALWLVRPEAAGPKALAEQLRAIRDKNLRDIDPVIAQQKDFDPEFCRRYYTEYLRFSFDDLEKQGLRRFAEVCADGKLIPNRDVKFRLV